MSQIQRDIVITLIVKFSLLTVLWFVCFKGARPVIDIHQQWSIGQNQEPTRTSSFQKMAHNVLTVKHEAGNNVVQITR